MMTEQKTSPMGIGENVLWGLPVKAAGCDVCDRTYLLTTDHLYRCPGCGQSILSYRSAMQREEPPELIIPFSTNQARLKYIYSDFTKGILFRPTTFAVEMLLQKTIHLYIPMWLVDGDVVGNWKAEAGFDYQVKSSQEVYSGNRWQTREFLETRIRWESRMGEVRRHFDNVTTSALEDMEYIQGSIGPYSYKHDQPFKKDLLKNSIIQVPDLLPKDMIGNAQQSLNGQASASCKQACLAQHVRNFSINATYQNLKWTQLLLPVYATTYQDDQNVAHLVLVNGQTGKVHGPRFASQKKGWMWAGILGGIGATLLAFGVFCTLLAALFPPLGILGIILVGLALLVLISAIFPAAYPWQQNRKQRSITIHKFGKSSK